MYLSRSVLFRVPVAILLQDFLCLIIYRTTIYEKGYRKNDENDIKQ